VPGSVLEPWADTLFALDANFLLALLAPYPGAASGLDFAGAISAVGCPALLLRASLAKGGAIPDVDLAFFLQHARSFEVVEFDAGHGIHLDDPAAVVETIERFAPL